MGLKIGPFGLILLAETRPEWVADRSGRSAKIVADQSQSRNCVPDLYHITSSSILLL